MNRLIEKADERRSAEGLTRSDFSRALGLSASYWPHIVAGRRRPGPKVLRALAFRYSDLWNDILLFLAENPTIVGPTPTITGKESSRRRQDAA